MLDFIETLTCGALGIFFWVLGAGGLLVLMTGTIYEIVTKIKEIRNQRELLRNPPPLPTVEWEYEEWEQILADPEGVYYGQV